MRVNPYGQYALELSSHSDLFHGQTASRSRKNENGSGSASGAKTSSESIWHKVASQYDVSSLTEDELADMARELWSGGAISYQDYAMMSPKAASDDVKKSDSRYLTEADERGARDWVNEYEQLAQFLLDKGEVPTAQLVQRVLSVLTQVKLARSGPLDIRV